MLWCAAKREDEMIQAILIIGTIVAIAFYAALHSTPHL